MRLNAQSPFLCSHYDRWVFGRVVWNPGIWIVAASHRVVLGRFSMRRSSSSHGAVARFERLAVVLAEHDLSSGDSWLEAE